MDIAIPRLTQTIIWRLALTGLCLAILTLTAAGKRAEAIEPYSEKDRVENPYCDVPTYAGSRINGSARAYLTARMSPIIIIDRKEINKSALADFFLAHECCHHKLGHLTKKRKPVASVNGRAITRQSAKMEADADCCAAKILTYYRKPDAIEKAKTFMRQYGRMPTGFGYPTGVSRFGAIEDCRLRAEREFASRLKANND